MAMQTPQDLFKHELGDIYDAEQTIVGILSTLAGEVDDQDVRSALQHHEQETRRQIQNLDQCFQIIGAPGAGGLHGDPWAEAGARHLHQGEPVQEHSDDVRPRRRGQDRALRDRGLSGPRGAGEPARPAGVRQAPAGEPPAGGAHGPAR
ncbi:MAG: DUF892 family protein [Thermomicrobiaceae bacterium]|nr:DUF892 family protein [Thermomicrobiaceae bacterium]